MYHVAHSDLLMQKELPYEVHFGHSEPPAPGGFIGESEIHSGHSTSSATGGVIDESFGWSSRNECGTIPIREIRPQYPCKNPFHELDNDMFMDKNSGIYHTDSRTDFVREDNQMSYIGIMVSKKGIAAFGDSKSSRKVGTNYYVDPNWDIAKMADICHDFVASAIALGDKCLPYNPVGGEIQVETLS